MISHGPQISKDGIPHGTEHPHGTHDISHVHHDIPHGTEHPTVLMISPTVLNTPTVLKISPHGTQDIPPWYSRYPPTVLMIPPTVLKISPQGNHDSPHGTHDSPHGPEQPPRYCTHIIQGE